MLNIDEAIVLLGKRIQEARLLRNITQEQLADHCEVTAKHISAIERGTTPGSVSILLSICDFLNISPDALFVDSFSKDTASMEHIIPDDKHDIIVKYAKLSTRNQEFVNSVIEHEFNSQTRCP